MIFFQFSLFLLIGSILFVYYRDTGLAAPEASRPDLPGVHLEQPAARNCGTGDCRDSGRRHVEPERGAQFARLHDRHGFLPAAIIARSTAPRTTRVTI